MAATIALHGWWRTS
ncbi:trp operon leader peptide [Salmonella enterica]|nr:trp operon leader peptide [Salmonella enterica]EAB6690024.1 trp operon leader peptide [Salmonella enterica subsp. enterica serovar Kapemba]EBV1472890.1 trp operon leader peptide [Salmonella enterica subsp. enterica serovar Stanleyville]EBW6884990.1 trp operon leader peptide [Salmonella enterica subsp. enterica serovar Mikawasima]EBZ5785541.1 trp operon leader peptide [Salmonella enterica subsp. enterica serovar Lawndale]ECB3359741.1 trp operon leader peptide [Salmonella enterica subsp. ente